MPPRKVLPIRKNKSGKRSGVKRLSDTPKSSVSKPVGCFNSSKISNSPVYSHNSSKPSNVDPTTSSNKADVIEILDILNINWKVFRVSPMYNFHESHFEAYGRKLNELLGAQNYKNENAAFSSKFSCGKLSLKETYNCVKIYVVVNRRKYIGFLISPVESLEENGMIKHFPILLVRSEEKLSKQVHNGVCKLFDCDIHSVVFSYRSLITFFTLICHKYINDYQNLGSEPVSLHYKIPGIAPSNSITIALRLAATAAVLAGLMRRYESDVSSMTLIVDFYNKILVHIFKVYRTDLSAAELFRIVFPHFKISSEGWVRFSSEEVLDRALVPIKDLIRLEHLTERLGKY